METKVFTVAGGTATELYSALVFGGAGGSEAGEAGSSRVIGDPAVSLHFARRPLEGGEVRRIMQARGADCISVGLGEGSQFLFRESTFPGGVRGARILCCRLTSGESSFAWISSGCE